MGFFKKNKKEELQPVQSEISLPIPPMQDVQLPQPMQIEDIPIPSLAEFGMEKDDNTAPKESPPTEEIQLPQPEKLNDIEIPSLAEFGMKKEDTTNAPPKESPPTEEIQLPQSVPPLGNTKKKGFLKKIFLPKKKSSQTLPLLSSDMIPPISQSLSLQNIEPEKQSMFPETNHDDKIKSIEEQFSKLVDNDKKQETEANQDSSENAPDITIPALNPKEHKADTDFEVVSIEDEKELDAIMVKAEEIRNEIEQELADIDERINFVRPYEAEIRKYNAERKMLKKHKHAIKKEIKKVHSKKKKHDAKKILKKNKPAIKKEAKKISKKKHAVKKETKKVHSKKKKR